VCRGGGSLRPTEKGLVPRFRGVEYWLAMNYGMREQWSANGLAGGNCRGQDAGVRFAQVLRL
jgi:hypothetical protein